MMQKPDPALAEYKPIIDKLKLLHGQPEFDKALKSLAQDIPKPKQFLIKMELNRLATTCNRIIDLRGHVEGDVKEFEYDNKLHHLDEIAIRIFKRGLKNYGGFTVGIFEDIQNADNNFRVIHQRQTQQRLEDRDNKKSKTKKADSAIKTDYPAKAVWFGARGFRSEERMIYSMAIDIELPIVGLTHAVTTDLSVSGCKIKLPSNCKVLIGQKIKVEYTGLEEEFSLGLNTPVEYEVVGLDYKGEHQYPRCRRTSDVKSTSFDDFLTRFINGNKRRYKINLDNTVDAIVTKGYEQFYLPRVTSLPVFIKEHENGLLEPQLMLTNDNNKAIIRQWLDEDNQSCLSLMLSHKRLKSLLKLHDRVKETLIYGFTHISKGHIYFYSATIEELNQDPDTKRQFLAFGSSKANWFVYKLQLVDCSSELAHIPSTMPNTASEIAEKLNKPPSTRVLGQIKDVKYLVSLTDISGDDSKNTYSQLGIDMNKVNLLKPFGHAKNTTITKIEEVPIKFVNLRSEMRFSYRTEMELIGDLVEASGITRDFSTKGMQVEFDIPINVEKEEIVKINMTALQKITKRYNLKGLAYEVVGFNSTKTLINFQVYEQKGVSHIGRQFLSELVDKNREKLKAAASSGSTLPGLAEALRNIFVQRLENTAMYVHKDGIRHEINTIGFSMMPNALIDAIQNSNEAHDYNLFPFLSNNYLHELFVSNLRKMQRHHRPVAKDIYIKIRPDETDLTQKYEVQRADKFRNQAAEKIFLQKATQQKSMLFALRLFINRTGRPDTDFISKELAYVSQYAIHKAKVLENELWSVAGVIDIVDITEEVLTRYGFSDKVLNDQQIKRHKPN